jgi:SAM-dependent methyltransferase
LPSERGHASRCRCHHPTQSLNPYFSAQDYVTGDRFQVGYCRQCGLHVTSPVPSEAEIVKYYPPAYYGSGRRFAHVVEWMLDIIYRYRVWEIERHQRPGKALDIGCGRGLLLHKLRERGWDVRGTELSEDAASYARNVLGLPVTTESLQDAQFPDSEFDLIILWHVLEHMHAPRGVLKEVSRILKPGGRLLLATPNFGSWEARWGREHWFHLNVPGHLTHFTPRTLKRLLDEEGLRLAQRSFFSTEYDFFSFAQTALNKMGFRPNRLYNILRTPAAKVKGYAEHAGRTRSRSATVLEDLALLVCAPFLLGASLVYAPVAAALRKGATIALIAVKPHGEAR